MAETRLIDQLQIDVERTLAPPTDVPTVRFPIPPDVLPGIVEKVVESVIEALLTRAATSAIGDWWSRRKAKSAATAAEHADDSDDRIEAELERVSVAGIKPADLDAVRHDVRRTLTDLEFADAHAERISEEVVATVKRRFTEHHET